MEIKKINNEQDVFIVVRRLGFNPTETDIYKIQTNATFLWPQRNVAQRNSLADFVICL